MPRLFWKIFGWFWGAMVLIGLALYFVVLTTRPDPLPAAWRTTAASALQATATAAAAQWERGGKTALAQNLANEGERTRTHLWLFSSDGRELSGKPLPSKDDPGNRGGRRDGPRGGRGGPPDGLFGFPRENRGQPDDARTLAQLRMKAARENETAFESFGPRAWAITPIRTQTNKLYFLAALMPSPRFGRPAAAPQTQFFGGLVALVLSGVVCLGLVRYLTAPLVSLREATQKLACGDLSARTSAASNKRRDEVADMGRDFDAMAARIETLVGSQRQLLGDISHELRSPLARLAMALALARRHAENSTPEMANALDRIARETTRLNALIGQLLELARLEGGGTTANERIDLQELAREVVADADYEAKNRNRAVEVETSPCFVMGTRELLHSALENVVRNAIRHTAPETTVQVQLEQNKSDAILRVRDWGSGAPEESLPHLFEPFYRAEAARDRDSGGVGLGLAITQRAIRSHGGTVIARNAPRGGLEIEMRLPLAPYN